MQVVTSYFAPELWSEEKLKQASDLFWDAVQQKVRGTEYVASMGIGMHCSVRDKHRTVDLCSPVACN